MFFGQRWFGITLGILGFALLMAFEYTGLTLPKPEIQPADLTVNSTPNDVKLYMDWQFANMSVSVRMWLFFWHYMTFAAILFGLRYKEAQYYVAALIGNHAILGLGIAFLPPNLVSFKFASFTIWLFIPVIIAMIRAWKKSDWPVEYRLWVGLAIIQLCISMVFDIPDGLEFLHAAIL